MNNERMTNTEILVLMQTQLIKHGLYAKGWRGEFDHAIRRGGSCCHKTKTITLSRRIMTLNADDLKFINNTILHEIAHALLGKGHGHDAVWKRKALEIGCDGQRCYDKRVVRPETRYVGHCPVCNFEYKKIKAPKGEQSCGKCSSRFDKRFLIVFKLNPKFKGY